MADFPGTVMAFDLPRAARCLQAEINVVTVVGDSTIIAGVALTTIKVWKLYMTHNGVTTARFRNGTAGTFFDGPRNVSVGTTLVLDLDGEPWFECSTAQNFVFNSTVAAIQISGRIYYTQN